MSGLNYCPVDDQIHKGPGVGSDLISEPQDTDYVADCLTNLRESGKVALHQGVEQFLHFFRFQNKINKEIVHPTQESSPFEKVTATDDHQDLIGGLAQM